MQFCGPKTCDKLSVNIDHVKNIYFYAIFRQKLLIRIFLKNGKIRPFLLINRHD